MSRDNPQAVRRRLWSLATGELASIVVLPAVAYGLVGWPLSPANLLGTALAVLILLEGAAYWLLKLRSPARPAGMRVFAVLRWLNPALLAAAVPVLVVALLTGPMVEALPGLAFWALAVGEHVNYFHTQLTGGRRPAHLGRDLARRR